MSLFKQLAAMKVRPILLMPRLQERLQQRSSETKIFAYLLVIMEILSALSTECVTLIEAHWKQAAHPVLPPVTMAHFRLDNTACGIIVSFVAYILFYALFVAAQLWWAFALIATGLYFIPMLFALQRNEKLISLIFTFLHVLATAGIFGWTIFFFCSIFRVNTVDKWLHVYTKNTQNPTDVAKYASIAMTVDGAITGLIMLFTAALCYAKVRILYKPKEEESVYEGTLAINTEIDFPVYNVIPRLRTTSVGEIRGQSSTTRAWDSQSARYSRKAYAERF